MERNSSEKLHFSLVSPEQPLLSQEVSMVIIPAAHGDLGVLPNHAPMVLALKPGIVEIHQDGVLHDRIFVSHGFANIHDNGCTVMCDECVYVNDIDESQVEDYVKEVLKDIEHETDVDQLQELERNLTIARAKMEIFRKLGSKK